jgi:hypothetical protein
MSAYVKLEWKSVALATALSMTLSLGISGNAMAGNSGAPGNSSEPAASSSAATNSPAASSATADPSSAVIVELQALRESVEQQTKQFDEHSKELEDERQSLKEEIARISAIEEKLGVPAKSTDKPAAELAANPVSLEPAASSSVSPAVTASVLAPNGGAASQDPDSIAHRLDTLEKRVKNIGPFSFGGDIRLRQEPYFGGPEGTGTNNESQVRDRFRYRVRFYANAKLNDDISGGIALASGDVYDPITTDQDANGGFTRKPFSLDKAFLQYTPHQVSPLTLIGGKFAYPWYNTELTWDKDLNPEGAAQKLEWQSNNWKVLRQFALIGFELPFSETQQTETNTSFNTNSPSAVFPYMNNSIKQSVVYGGQIQTRWQLTHWLSFTADTAFYNWHNADPLVLETQQQDAGSPLDGLLKLGSSASNLVNTYQTVTESFSVPVSPTTGTCTVGAGGTCKTTAVNSVIIAGKLDSKFAMSDSIAQFDINTGHPRWPVRFLGDYVQNTGACGNDPAAAPLTTAQETAISPIATFVTAVKNPSTGAVNPATGAAASDPHAINGCDPRYRRANWLEGRFGRQELKGDLQVSYTHMLIEREAVLSIFNYSQMRQGSALAQNRIEAFYQWNNNVQFVFTALFGLPTGPTPPSTGALAQSSLTRIDFDVTYKF